MAKAPRLAGKTHSHAPKTAREDTSRFQSFYERTPAMLHSIDAEGRVISVSDVWLRVLGYERHEVVGRKSTEFLSQASQELAKTRIPEFFKVGHASEIPYEFVAKDGHLVEVLVSAVLERDEDGKPLRSSAFLLDVTERNRIARELLETRERNRVTLDTIGIAVINVGLDFQVSHINRAAECLTGWKAANARRAELSQVLNFEEGVRLDPVQLASSSAAKNLKSVALTSRSGLRKLVDGKVAATFGTDGKPSGFVIVLKDITEQERRDRDLARRADQDPLTGLLNRAFLERALGPWTEKASATMPSHALLHLDLDQFKVINDTSGHTTGDRILKQVADLLRRELRQEDILTRMGGDEFGVLLKNRNKVEALQIAQRLCDRIQEARFGTQKRRFRIGCSIGLVTLDRRWRSVTAILKAADEATLVAKDTGRNRVYVGDESNELFQERQRQVEWVSRIENALEEDRFVLFHQRIEQLQEPESGVHAEILLRLCDEGQKVLAPGMFMPAAERYGMSRRLDEWVVKHTLQWMQENPRASAGICNLSINLTGYSLSDTEFHEWLRQTIDSSGVDPRKLCFEITETVAISHLSQTNDFLKGLRARGCRVALDDFGSGVSSYGYLKWLEVDSVKIDRQFVKDVVKDPIDLATVRSIHEIVKIMGKRTVAEGVEDLVTLVKLRELGVDHAQGYHIHRPSPLDELADRNAIVNDGRAA